MSLPKSRLDFGSAASRRSWSNRNLRLEDVDAHRGERHVGLVGHAGRVLGLLEEGDDAVVAVDMHDAEAGRLHARHLEAADRHVGAAVDVLLQHQLVVHRVDVIAGEDDDVTRAVARDDVDVLEDGVGRALVPLVLRDALARGQDVEALVPLGAEEVPAALEMADQAVGLVLGRDGDAADAGVERVRQREVDDARLAAEEDRGLGPLVGQLHQPAAAASGEHIGHGVARQRRIDSPFRHDHPLPRFCRHDTRRVGPPSIRLSPGRRGGSSSGQRSSRVSSADSQT